MRLIDADALERRLSGWYDPYHEGGDEIEIDTLFDMIDEESTDFGWISVKERLPEKGTRALVWIKSEYESYPSVWSFDDDEWDIATWQKWVTHWMPLPDPPEVGE